MKKSEDLKSELPPPIPSLGEMAFYVQEKFRLYETRARFYLIGSDRNRRFFRVLKFDRLEPSDLYIDEDPAVYSSREIDDLLRRIADGNKATGGLTFVTEAYGIAGCVKFLESYYLILITKRKQVGLLCGHVIYSIQESQTITIPHASVQTDAAHSKTELRYKKLLCSVDLTKDFFYSYTYPIMQSLQKNVLSRTGMPYDNIFVWNDYLTREIRSICNNSIWTVALVHGYFEQARLSIFGREFSISLISRRSRYFAGTRYLKRGVNDLGKVANDVETEQIILEEEAGSYKGQMSSVVQMRGSVPLFWSQETSRFSPKPDIVLQRYDPTYEATKLHFEDLAERYGNPIIVFNLIKTVEKRPREMILRREFANAVGYLNQILPKENELRYIHWDFHKFSKTKSPNKYGNILGVLRTVAREAIDLTGFYYSGKRNIKKMADKTNPTSNGISLHSPFFQNGVMRTNCIDCLDRTNIAQFAFGLQALGCQLKAMGLSDVSCLDSDSSIAAALMDMYRSMGDALAEQYGGSAAHNTVFPEQPGKWKATTQSREFLKSLKRYYCNTYTDGEKQDAINLFLGCFQPQEGKPALWELESDYHLHVSGAGNDLKILDNWSKDPAGIAGTTPLRPLPACREDFSRIKLTSFDKLIEKTRGAIRDVRISSEPDQTLGGGYKKSGVAPDAAEIQLKSANWIFGQRNHQGSVTEGKATSHETDFEKCQAGKKDSGFDNLDWLFSSSDMNEEETMRRYQEMASVNEENENGWYGGSLLRDFDENSEIYKHYAALCHIPELEPFKADDPEKEKHYADVLRMGSFDALKLDDVAIAAEMERALKEYDQIGEDFGIIPKSCKFLAENHSWLTRWLIGKEKVPTRGSM
ncbi:phosphoinositide phosphatase SAC1-like [Neltuma alba]|uniref:phosphoinositide phosphatase SAC1-like n=1 Tax=Neltuma alba TaxID=207710 RepID=UPI0010A3785A|nr:phosphoinositide phosphatase SAC1-like [Prosopis alba]